MLSTNNLNKNDPNWIGKKFQLTGGKISICVFFWGGKKLTNWCWNSVLAGRTKKLHQKSHAKREKHENTYEVNEHWARPHYIVHGVFDARFARHHSRFTAIIEMPSANAQQLKWKISIICVLFFCSSERFMWFVWRAESQICPFRNRLYIMHKINMFGFFHKKFKLFENCERTLMVSRFCAWINPFALAQPYIHINDGQKNRAEKRRNKNNKIITI